MQGIVIAGTHSGCGKTTITLGILAALRKKGIDVQSFKAGPDFIDAGLHTLITGKPSRNLDIWMCGEDYVKESFEKYSKMCGIAVVEGVMGLYDGNFSTAYLSALLNLPVILVVDAYGMAESAGAIVKGFIKYSNQIQVTSNELEKEDLSLVTCHLSGNPSNTPLEKGGGERFGNKLSKLETPNSQLNISGVIFNRVGSENHYKRLKESVQDVRVLGYLPRDLDFEIPHRHLGLIVAEEKPITNEKIEKLADAVLSYIDIDLIIKKSSLSYLLHSHKSGNPEAVCSNTPDSCLRRNDKKHSSIHLFTHSPLIAVAYDKAFNFYYEDNLDLLKEAGAEIVKFSPLSGSKIPDGADAVYIGGGYPELYAETLSKNKKMLKAVKDWAESGKPLYAECGGLIYLSQGIWKMESGKRKKWKMADVLPFETQILPIPPLAKGGTRGLRPHLGYRKIVLKEDCILGKKGDRLRGHEFHYSEIKGSDKLQVTSCELKNKKDSGDLSLVTCYSLLNSNRDEGYKFKNTLASYIHLHFGSNKDAAAKFISDAKGEGKCP